MAEAGEKEIRRKEREPITMVCFVVFLLACAAVIGVFINDKYLKDNDDIVGYGETVSVDYVGSLYDYYGKDNASVIFDTTISDVGKSDDYAKLASFNKTSFSPATVTVGAGKYLADFENAIKGAAVGDTVKVKISKENAYVAGDFNKKYTQADAANCAHFNNGFTMTLTEFRTQFDLPSNFTPAGYYEVKVGELVGVVTVNGSNVFVNYNVAVGSTYKVNDNISLNIVAVDGSDVTYKIILSDVTPTSDVIDEVKGIKMVGVKLAPSFVINVVANENDTVVINDSQPDSDGKDPAINNMDLYFVITILERK